MCFENKCIRISLGAFGVFVLVCVELFVTLLHLFHTWLVDFKGVLKIRLIVIDIIFKVIQKL